MSTETKQSYELVLPKDIQKNSISRYGSTFAFSFVSAPSASKNTITLRTNFFTCRDSFLELLNHRVKSKLGQMSGSNNGFKYEKIPLLATRIVVGNVFNDEYRGDIKDRQKTVEAEINRGVTLLNILEKKYNWKQTKAFNIKFPISSVLMMVVGDNKWLRSTHYTSLFCLILRLGRSEIFSKITNYENLIETCTQYSKTGANDASHVTKTLRWWGHLMEDFDELFKDMPIETVYDQKYLNSYYGEGIRRLCTMSSANKFLQGRFNKLNENKWKETLVKDQE